MTRVTNPADRIVWQSKVISGLVITEQMLKYLRHRYSHVKSWHNLMLDLETYLVRRPDKTPKDFRRFVLNCAHRHSDDITKGLRHPDGKVNLKAFTDRRPDQLRNEMRHAGEKPMTVGEFLTKVAEAGQTAGNTEENTQPPTHTTGTR